MTLKLNFENVHKKFLNELCKKVPLNLNYKCTYTQKKIFAPLVYAANENISLESINEELPNIPNSDTTFYHIKKLGWKDVLEIFQRMISQNYLQMRKMYRLTGKVKVAIDKWIIRGKQKNGTTRFFRIATVDIVKRGRRFTLAAIPINTFKSKRKVVEDLVNQMKNLVKIECILMTVVLNP